MLDVSSGLLWNSGIIRLFKWIPAESQYAPDSPWTGVSRFNDGSHKMLYLAESPKGAMAEYFRLHPELLDFQEELRIMLFELEIDVRRDGLDVRTEVGQVAVGISLLRLTSSEANESVRYAECHSLAALVFVQDMSGIAYPSAAAKWSGAWNLVLFGDQNLMIWKSNAHKRIPRPVLAASEIQSIFT